jgi:HAD superfamily hydrolase (TIGR01549 family)
VIKAILFDLGATLWDDYPSELAYWQCVSGLLCARGILVSLEQIVARVPAVIASFCPSLTRSLVWHFVGGDKQAYDEIIAETMRRMIERNSEAAEFRRLNPLFDGVHDMLSYLAGRYPLGIVSQNVAEARGWMAMHGIDSYFTQVSLSGPERLYKPDPRLFLLTCEALGVEPRDTVMVGDRLDNDIWPANRLHMTTVRVLAEPYRIQQPRYHNDVPDFTVERVADVLKALPL